MGFAVEDEVGGIGLGFPARGDVVAVAGGFGVVDAAILLGGSVSENGRNVHYHGRFQHHLGGLGEPLELDWRCIWSGGSLEDVEMVGECVGRTLVQFGRIFLSMS